MEKIIRLKDFCDQYEITLKWVTWDSIKEGGIHLILYFDQSEDASPTALFVTDPVNVDYIDCGYDIVMPKDSIRCSIILGNLKNLGRTIIISFDNINFPENDGDNKSVTNDLTNKQWFDFPPDKQGILYQAGLVFVDEGKIQIGFHPLTEDMFNIYIPTYLGNWRYPAFAGRLCSLGRGIVIPMEQI